MYLTIIFKCIVFEKVCHINANLHTVHHWVKGDVLSVYLSHMTNIDATPVNG